MGIKNLFKRKNDEIVDLADLQKRGIYKPKLPEKDGKGIMDFSKTSQDSGETQEGSALGFLSAMAESSSGELEASASLVAENKKKKLSEVLGNMKSDIRQNNDKVYKLIERIDLLEKKLERIERRVGI